MNKIEEILDDLLKQSPELIENKNKIRQLLLTMQENNPEVFIDSGFKQALKNKLEIQNYAKLKNTQNKKINIAEKGTMSFKKDAKSIFEKPKFNFFKLLAPVFVGCFAMFGFFHFFGESLFDVKKGGNLEYAPVKIQEKSLNNNTKMDAGMMEGVSNIQMDSQPDSIKKESIQIDEVADIIDTDVNAEDTNQQTINTEVKNSIAEKIKKRNAEKVVEREVQKVKIEDDFTKNLINEMKVNEEKDLQEASVIDEGAAEGSIQAQETTSVKALDDSVLENQEVSDTESVMSEDSSVNTEIIDVLGDETEDLEGIMMESDSIDSMGASLMPLEESLDDNIEVEKSTFELFCEEKGGIIKNNICTYGELTCSEEDFKNNICK